MKVRVFAIDDLTAVYTIQLKCPHMAQWREEDYLQLVRDPGGTILVAEAEATNPPAVAGFAAFHRILDEAELRNIAVDPRQRRRGIARALLTAGIRTMHEVGVLKLFLEVRASNQPALALYRAAGFQSRYTRHDYYHDPTEDALVMVCDLTASSKFPSGQK